MHTHLTHLGITWRSSAFLAAVYMKKIQIARELLRDHGRMDIQWRFIRAAVEDCGIRVPDIWLIPPTIEPREPV